jgi:hypothetical protein
VGTSHDSCHAIVATLLCNMQWGSSVLSEEGQGQGKSSSSSSIPPAQGLPPSQSLAALPCAGSQPARQLLTQLELQLEAALKEAQPAVLRHTQAQRLNMYSAPGSRRQQAGQPSLPLSAAQFVQLAESTLGKHLLLDCADHLVSLLSLPSWQCHMPWVAALRLDVPHVHGGGMMEHCGLDCMQVQCSQTAHMSVGCTGMAPCLAPGSCPQTSQQV